MKKNLFMIVVMSIATFSSCDKKEFNEDLKAIGLVNQSFEAVKASTTDGSAHSYDSKTELESVGLYEHWKFLNSGYIEDVDNSINIGTYIQDFSKGTIEMTDGKFLGKHVLHIGKNSFVFGMSKNGVHYNVEFMVK